MLWISILVTQVWLLPRVTYLYMATRKKWTLHEHKSLGVPWKLKKDCELFVNIWSYSLLEKLFFSSTHSKRDFSDIKELYNLHLKEMTFEPRCHTTQIKCKNVAQKREIFTFSFLLIYNFKLVSLPYNYVKMRINNVSYIETHFWLIGKKIPLLHISYLMNLLVYLNNMHGNIFCLTWHEDFHSN